MGICVPLVVQEIVISSILNHSLYLLLFKSKNRLIYNLQNSLYTIYMLNYLLNYIIHSLSDVPMHLIQNTTFKGFILSSKYFNRTAIKE